MFVGNRAIIVDESEAVENLNIVVAADKRWFLIMYSCSFMTTREDRDIALIIIRNSTSQYVSHRQASFNQKCLARIRVFWYSLASSQEIHKNRDRKMYAQKDFRSSKVMQ